MLKRSEAELDRVFQALAHPIRRDVLRRVMHRDCSVSELAEHHSITLEGVSQHIKVLERAKLIRRVRRGREQRLRLDPSTLRSAGELIAKLTRHWEDQMDALERWLDETRDEV